MRTTKTKGALTLLLLASAALLAVASARVSTGDAGGDGRRIRFQITAVEEGAAGRRVISDAAVEGPAGADFNVNLHDGRFRVSARFLTDLVAGGALSLRARLDTRRLYGRSEAGLPLYEEDSQRHALRLGFEEAVVLLPFGDGGEPRLRIEIKPSWAAPRAGASAPEITIAKPSPGGTISVEATKVPHDFTVEAALLEDGREVARGAAECLLEETRALPLRPVGADDESAAAVGAPALDFTVERFEPGPGAGRVAVRFDLSREDPRRPGAREALARNWAGVAGVGSELTYDLGPPWPGARGRKYELRLRVNLAPAGRAAR